MEPVVVLLHPGLGEHLPMNSSSVSMHEAK